MDQAPGNLLRLRHTLDAADSLARCADAVNDRHLQRQLRKAGCDLLERSLLAADNHTGPAMMLDSNDWRE